MLWSVMQGVVMLGVTFLSIYLEVPKELWPFTVGAGFIAAYAMTRVIGFLWFFLYEREPKARQVGSGLSRRS